MLEVYAISAACEGFGIGLNDDLPWRLKNELSYFHRMTTTTVNQARVNVILMGRKTYFSTPKNMRPFPGRISVVLSRNKIDEPGVITCSNWDEAIDYCSTLHEIGKIEKVWVIGGSSIYKMALKDPICKRVYLTRIFAKFHCDVFFPYDTLIEQGFSKTKDPFVPSELQEENGIRYQFEVYQRMNKSTTSNCPKSVENDDGFEFKLNEGDN